MQVSHGMLHELLCIALLLHVMMVGTAFAMNHAWDVVFVWEGIFMVLSATALLWMHRPPSRTQVNATVLALVCACTLRWTHAWWSTHDFHLYATMVSVGLYTPLLMLVSAPLNHRSGLWVTLGAILAIVSGHAALQPHLQGRIFDDIRLAPVIFFTLLLCIRYLNRWSEHIIHLQEGRLREAALSKAASTDGLTGLLNRQGIEQTLLSVQRSAAVWSVLLVDVDHFKRVNDQHGHLVGDQVLQAVGQRLQAGVRSADGVARWGGEEFLIVLPNTTMPDAALVGEKLRADIASHKLCDVELGLTVSIGVAEHTPHSTTEQTIKAADDALYDAKNAGRDRVCVVARKQAPQWELPPRAS